MRGYSGGGSSKAANGVTSAAGGGGSFNAGTDRRDKTGANIGDDKVVIIPL